MGEVAGLIMQGAGVRLEVPVLLIPRTATMLASPVPPRVETFHTSRVPPTRLATTSIVLRRQGCAFRSKAPMSHADPCGRMMKR